MICGMIPALEGITVLDFSTVGPGARCTRILADYGARVVKIGVPPKKTGLQVEPAHWAYSAGRGMERIRIDLKAPAGRAAVLKLAASADVILESYRPGVVKRLGIGYEDIRAVNPGIVYCSTSGYGQHGPASAWAGHDINYLAMGGYLACTGPRADGGPPIPGATIADAAAGGMHAALAIMAALLRRGKTGEGEYLDVSVVDGVISLMSLYVDQHLATGEEPGPGHDILTGRYACYDTYEASDGRWLAVGAIEPHFYANLCKALGCEQWLEHQLDDAVQDRVRADFAAAFRSRGRDDWVARLSPNDTCVAPVYTIAELTHEPHFVARGAFAEADHPVYGIFRQTAPALAGMARSTGAVPVPDGAKTDTQSVLAAVGVPADEIEKLRADGTIA